MAPACCSCRSTALRTFVRSVAQVHLPNDNLARAAPWHETRRQLHQRGTARWPAVTSLPYRTMRTATTVSDPMAAETEKDQSALEAQEHHGEEPPAESHFKSEASRQNHRALQDAVAEEEKFHEATHEPAVPVGAHRQGVAQPYDQVAEDDPEVESFSVEEIEAEQRARELNRLRMRAERANAREQAKKEQRKQKEEAKKQREKERLKARPEWAIQKEALKEKFPEGWRPRKKLSPDALNGIRALNRQFPDTYTTEVLANKFEVSPEAIRRILRSKWEATSEEDEERERRWHNRGVNIWQHYAAIGKKPPAKWREAGVVVQPRGGRDRSWEQERGSHGRYDEPTRDEESVDYEQRDRYKRQQKLAKSLL